MDSAGRKVIVCDNGTGVRFCTYNNGDSIRCSDIQRI